TVREWMDATFPRLQAPFAVAATVLLVLRWDVLQGLRLPDVAVDPWSDPLAAASFTGRLLMPFRLLTVTAGVLLDPGRLCPLWSAPAVLPPPRLAADVLVGGVLALAVMGAGPGLVRRRSPPPPPL